MVEGKKYRMKLTATRGGIPISEMILVTPVGEHVVGRMLNPYAAETLYGVFTQGGKLIKGGFDRLSEAIEFAKMYKTETSSLGRPSVEQLITAFEQAEKQRKYLEWLRSPRVEPIPPGQVIDELLRCFPEAYQAQLGRESLEPKREYPKWSTPARRTQLELLRQLMSDEKGRMSTSTYDEYRRQRAAIEKEWQQELREERKDIREYEEKQQPKEPVTGFGRLTPGGMDPVAKDIYTATRGEYILEGIIIGPDFNQAAKIRIPSTRDVRVVPLGEPLQMSKHARRKAARYGVPVPASISHERITAAVVEYWQQQKERSQKEAKRMLRREKREEQRESTPE